MELKQLEAFVSVADCRSFSKAAEALYLTQPTVSSHIAALEKEIGSRLFTRTTKSLKLTEDGQRLYPYAVRMVELRRTIRSEFAEKKPNSVAIGASTIPATYLLPAIVAKLAECGISFRISQGNSSGIEELVNDGSVEAGIIGQEAGGPGLVSEKLFTDRMVLVTPVNDHYAKYKKAGTRAADIAELLKNPLILREEGSGTQKAADLCLEEVAGGRKLNILARSNNQEAIKRMVAEGAGISVMSYLAAADLEEAGKVFCFPLALEKERCFYIIYRQDRELKKETKLVIKTAHELYG